MYEIEIETFKGPLDLLLSLISKQKVDIFEVSIADITDQYMAQLETMQSMDMEVATEFIVMASLLLFIKSKSMLPKTQEAEEEESPEEELKRRLFEYKVIKEASLVLSQRESEYAGIYSKLPEEIIIEESEAELNDIPLDALAEAFIRILQKKPYMSSEKPEIKLKRDLMSITQAIDIMKKTLEAESEVRFESFFEKYHTKQEIVTMFLALLELLKENILTVKQEYTYSSIIITRGNEWNKENKSA